MEYMKDVNSKKSRELFRVVWREIIRNNGVKLSKERLRLTLQTKFLTVGSNRL